MQVISKTCLHGYNVPSAESESGFLQTWQLGSSSGTLEDGIRIGMGLGFGLRRENPPRVQEAENGILCSL